MNEKDEVQLKIGAGHAEAMFRLGLNEIRAAVAPNSPFVQPNDPGIWGNATQSEIAATKSGSKDALKDRDAAEDHDSVLADRMRQAEARDDPGRDDREMERE